MLFAFAPLDGGTASIPTGCFTVPKCYHSGSVTKREAVKQKSRQKKGNLLPALTS